MMGWNKKLDFYHQKNLITKYKYILPHRKIFNSSLYMGLSIDR